MSIVKFFTDRFGRVRPITPKNETTQAVSNQPTTTPQQNVTLVDVRKEGFKDGVLEIDQTPFESWITHSEELEVVKHNLGVQRGELTRLTNHLNRSETDGERLRVEIAVCTENIRLQEQFLEQSRERIVEEKDQKQSLKHKLENLKPAYGFVPALFFLLAGVALLAADYVVSKEIVARGLDMGGTEAMMFATAMAMMAFAVKPAVDRIFEKEYKDGNSLVKRRNHFFVGTVAILVLFSLGLLGFFRSDADSYMTAIDSKRSEIANLDSQDQTTEILERKAKLIQEKNNLEQSLQDNPSKKWSLISLAVIFALAGAVCLSIAFPSLEAQYRKLRLAYELWRKSRSIFTLESKQATILGAISNNKGTIAKSNATISELKPANTLLEAIHELQIAIAENISKYHQINALALTGEYRDAYLEAISYDVEGRPAIYWKEVAGLGTSSSNNKFDVPQPSNTTAQNGGSAWYNRLLGSKEQPEVTSPQPTHAHQKLRKLIQDRKLN
jgi:hypothetical protein